MLCIDGDGSMLMHMGAVAVAGHIKRDNFKYIMINNCSHESVGGLPTLLDHVDFESFFKSLGFQSYYRADTLQDLQSQLFDFIQAKQSVLEIRVKQGSRNDLARPNTLQGN